MSKKIWRICQDKHKHTAFDGVGASLFGGRWNSQGLKMVYSSECLSLAALEVFVHLELADQTKPFVCIGVEITDDIAVETMDLDEIIELSPNGRAYPAPSVLAEYGDRWLSEKRTAVLIVPSAVVPQEHNYLLNPEHPDFAKIVITTPEPFSFDSRMWK